LEAPPGSFLGPIIWPWRVNPSFDVLYGVDLQPGQTPEFSAPQEVLRAQGLSMGGTADVWGWAITPDGKRVLARSLAAMATDTQDDIHVVVNWPALIK
jgi:hypothetical protein